MARRIRKQNKEGLAISLGRLAEGAIKGIGGLLGFAAEMERQGKSEHIEQGEIKGKTKSGKEYRGAYGLRVKVGLPVRSQEAKAGLNPAAQFTERASPNTLGREDFKGRKKLSSGVKNKT